MKKNPEDIVVGLFELRFTIENVLFREFMKQYEFPIELNSTHMKALLTLHYWGKQSMSELSRKLTLEKGSFTPVADKLISEQYIIKEKDSKDHRVYILSLTETGKNLACDFKGKHFEYIQQYVDKLSDKEKKELEDATMKVSEMVRGFNDGDVTSRKPAEFC